MKHLLYSIIFCILIISSFSFSATVSARDENEGSVAGCPEAGEVYQISTGNCVLKFIPLVGIPGINTQDQGLSLPDYVNALYTAAISIAAFLAVVKIIFAGVKYMLSDIVTTKEDAKKDIRGALIGLLIVIGAVLILNTINPQLKGLTALDSLEGISMKLTGNQTDCSVQPMPPSCCAEGQNYWIVGEIGLCADSANDVDELILDGELAEIAGDREILNEYNLEDIPPELHMSQERSNWIEENWTNPCEYDAATDTDTGNEWIEIESQTANGMRWACVRP